MRSIADLALKCSALDLGSVRSHASVLDCLCWARAHWQGLDVHFGQFPPFKPHFDTNDLQYNKTLKQTKILDINKAKSLTNIN
jgi:hypothetical protein